MNEERKPEVPFTLKLGQAAEVIGIGVGELKALIRSKKIEILNGSSGPKVPTESVIRYLGRERFKERWPLRLGEIIFDNAKEKKKERGR